MRRLLFACAALAAMFAATDVSATPPVAVAAEQAGASERAAGEDRAQPAKDAAGPVEELTVTERRLNLSADERRRIYERLREAQALYSRNRIDEAMPLLLETAERGFKDSQAKVGHIYLQGLGEVEKDAERAVGWLGVASAGTTSPPIRNYFNDVWERLPEQYVPYFEEVVEEYRSKYGGRATGVVCKMERPLSSFLKRLGCYFEEDVRDDVRNGLDSLRNDQENAERAAERRRDILNTIEQMRRSGLVR